MTTDKKKILLQLLKQHKRSQLLRKTRTGLTQWKETLYGTVNSSDVDELVSKFVTNNKVWDKSSPVLKFHKYGSYYRDEIGKQLNLAMQECGVWLDNYVSFPYAILMLRVQDGVELDNVYLEEIDKPILKALRRVPPVKRAYDLLNSLSTEYQQAAGNKEK